MQWERPVLTLPQNMEIDLGGIGKEYAVDRVVSLLAPRTEAAFLVNFGGDLRAVGRKRDGKPWEVGVERPGVADQAALTIELLQGAVATSGDATGYWALRTVTETVEETYIDHYVTETRTRTDRVKVGTLTYDTTVSERYVDYYVDVEVTRTRQVPDGEIEVTHTRTEITGSRYRLTSLLDRGAALETEVEKLRIEAAALSAPERVEPRARKLGLRYPEAGQIVPLEDPRGPITDVAAPPPEATDGGKAR